MKVTDMKPTKTAIYLSTILFAAALPSFAAEISNWKGGASGIWGVGYESNWDTYPDSTRYAKFGSPSSEPITVTVDETVEAYGVVISSGRTADLFFTGNGMLKNYRTQLIPTGSSIVTDWNINVTNINGNSALNIYGTNVFHKVLDCSDVYTFSVKDNAKVTLCDSAQLIGQHMTLAAGSSFECLDSSVSELTKDLKCSPGSSLKVADNSVLAVRGMWLPFTQQEGVDEEWTMEGGEIRSVGTNGLVLPYTNATKTVSGTGTLYAYKFSVDNASNLVIRLIGPKAYLGHTWFDGGDTRNIIFEVGGGSTLGAYGQDLYFQYWTNKVVGAVTVDTIDYADKSTPRTIAMSKFFDCNGTITVNGTGTFMINETITQPNLGLTVKDSATLGQVSWGSAYALGDIVLEDSARFDVPKYLGHKTTPNCVKSITMRDDTTLTVPRYVQASGDVVLSGNASAVICNSSNDSGAAFSCANLSLADNASLSVTGTIAATSLTMSGNSHFAFTAGTAFSAGASFGAGNWTMEITIPSGYEAGIRPVVLGAGFEGDFADHVTLVGDTEGWSARTLNGNLILYKGPLPTGSVSPDDGQTIFEEGDTVNFTVSLAAPNDYGMTLYAFLFCGGDVDPSIFSGRNSSCIITNTLVAHPNTCGLMINNAQSSVSGSFKVLDGGLDANYSFSVVLCTSSSYDPTCQIIYEVGNSMDISVLNAEPTINWIELNGMKSTGDGYTFSSSSSFVVVDAAQTFRAVVSDSGSYDLANDLEGKQFQTKWTCISYGVTKYSQVVYGSPIENTFSYAFPMSGPWTVRCQVKDKDMEDWSDATYSVNLVVLDAPDVEVTVPEELDEADTNQYVQIGVAYWEDSVLTARVEVVEGREGKANPGVLKLDSAYASQLPDEDNVYYVELIDGSAVIAIESMDGTDVSSLYGFTIRASIVSSDINYIPAQQRILIDNVAPACDATPENSTVWNVVIGGASTNSIRWEVRRDVAYDFAGTTSFPGIKVSFDGCDNAQSFYITEPSIGVFTPDFGSGMGDQYVYLTIEDKDGASQYWRYQYEVCYPKETIDGISWCYWISNGEASIEYGSEGDLSGDITIPSTIGGCPVTSIGGSAFEGCGDIVSVTIPEGVASIKDYAFRGCSSLVTVKIPDSVTSVGQLAFEDCTGLTSVVLPNTLTNIGWCAFSSCSSLTDVTIPGGVRSVVEHAFMRCRGLTNVTISAGVESIEAYAFDGCIGLTSLVIPDSVTNIADCAFVGCSGLASVTIPQSVCSSSRNSSAFSLVSVTNVVISDRATNIGKSTFSHWENLVSVTIGSSVTNIGQSAFYNCRNLTSVTIGNSVVNIEKGAFRDCEALPDIYIPSSVTNIGRNGFCYCTSLTNIVFYGNAPTCDDYAFEYIASGCVAFVSPKSTGWGVAAGEEWYGLTLQYWPEVLTAVGSAAEAQSILSEFADARIAAGISTVGEYNQFTAWANDKNLYQPDLKDSAHAWASYVLGAEALLANEPKIDFEAVEVGATESGSLGSASPTMTVSVSVRDGERAVAVDANSVAGMFEATSDLGDWAGAALSVDVEVVDDGGTSPSHQMRFKATPGGSSSQAFLRIRK